MSYLQRDHKNKKEKVITENQTVSLAKVFKDIPWALSGGTKHACIFSATAICAWDIDTVIEIGLWNGFTSLLLGRALACNAMHRGHLISVDIQQSKLNNCKKLTKDLPIQHTTIWSDSAKVDYYQHLNGKRVGLAFIDGDHAEPACTADLNRCAPLMTSTGIMVVHDYSIRHGKHRDVVIAVEKFIKANPSWQYFYLPENRNTTDYHTIILQSLRWKSTYHL